MDAMTVDAKAHDERTAGLYLELDKAERRLASVIERAHRTIGDRRMDRWTRYERWALTTQETLGALEAKANATPADEAIGTSDHPVNVFRAWQSASLDAAYLGEDIAAMDAIYREHMWTRFHPCNTSNGHIHASLGCHTLNKGQYATDMGWFPSLSGHTVAEAVAELGTWLCSVCFPDAPAEHCQTRSEATKAEREAKKAAASEAKLIKNLHADDWFRVDGETIRTVAACVTLLRKEVEYRDFYGHGETRDHADYVRGAAMATERLIRREGEKPGTGKTQAQIDTIIASAIKTQRQRGARLDEEGNVTA